MPFHNASPSAASATAVKGDTPPVWDLSPLYASPECPSFNADCEKTLRLAQAFRSSYAGRIAASAPADIEKAFRAFEEIERLTSKISAYAYLYYSENAADPARGAFYQKVSEHVSACQEEIIFFTLEINAPDDAFWHKVYAHSDYMAKLASWIERQRKMRPYLLSESEERTVIMKDVTGSQAWRRLFDETMAHLEAEIDGEKLSVQDVMHMLQSADKTERKKALTGISGALAAKAGLFTFVTNTLAKDKGLEDEKRGFARPISSRNLDNDIEDEAVDALLKAVESRYSDISHRYYRWKAKKFGADVLNYEDRNAPLPGNEAEKPTPWNDAKTLILNAYNGFSPEAGETAARIFEMNRIHALPAKGKDSGAYSHPAVPEACPFILMNYKGTQRDIMTLAHELGHGVHQYLCKDLGVLLSDTPLTVAETASVFGEQLTFRALLERAESKEAEERILAGKIEDMINTVIRQTSFCRFEQRLHDTRKKGEPDTKTICDIWEETQRASLGDAVAFPEEARIMWSYIPHFIHTPFYVYAYAFGDCLVNSLYRVYTEQPQGFAEKYLDLLKAGGSKRYDELLQPFGLNPRDPSFWHKGLDMISGLIDRLDS